ncbi:MAG: hypothetical protein WB509_27450 [Acetobacteraceae bacterium]
MNEIITGLARTGVVGVTRGNGASERAISLRVDMDALPILEEENLAGQGRPRSTAAFRDGPNRDRQSHRHRAADDRGADD